MAGRPFLRRYKIPARECRTKFTRVTASQNSVPLRRIVTSDKSVRPASVVVLAHFGEPAVPLAI